MKPYHPEDVQAAQRRIKLNREAEMDRLAKLAQGDQPGLTDRVLSSLGEWMIASGTRLKGRVTSTEYRVPSGQWIVNSG
jgi:hypothetical protein